MRTGLCPDTPEHRQGEPMFAPSIVCREKTICFFNCKTDGKLSGEYKYLNSAELAGYVAPMNFLP